MTLDPAVAAVRLAVRRDLSTVPDGTLVVACSGGADSLALLAATVFEAHRQGRHVVGAVVDHGLQDGSAEHTDRVVAQMARLGADETLSARVSVEGAGRGVEAAARDARYAVLGQVATTTQAVARPARAHARRPGRDRAAGPGPRQRRALARRHAARVRGLPAPAPRRDPCPDRAGVRRRGHRGVADPHNADPRFTRSRVRHAVLPVLEAELGPGVAAALARTAEQLRPDMEALDDLADLAYLGARDADGVLVSALSGHPDAVRSRVLRLAALEAGSLAAELFHVHVVALVALVTGDVRGEVQLPGHVTAFRDGTHLRFRPTEPPP